MFYAFPVCSVVVMDCHLCFFGDKGRSYGQLWLKAVGETLDDLPTRAYLLEVGQECCYRELADQQPVSKQCLEPIVQQLYVYMTVLCTRRNRI